MLIGIIIGIYFFPSIILVNISLFVLFVGLLAVYYLKSYFSDYSKRYVFGFFVNAFLLSFGILITQLQKPEEVENHFSKFETNNSVVQISEGLVEKKNSYKCEVEVIAVKLNADWKNTKGKAILYLEKDSNSVRLNYGDKIILNSKWDAVDLPTNPAQFNYRNYLYNSGIISQQYLNSGKWLFLDKSTDFSFSKIATNYQKRLLNILKSNFKGNELSVLSALLLGYKDLLDREIVMTYASSGAMHVLAVSGLHVGIIFMVLNSLLFFFEKIKYGTYVKATILIIALWIYAFITGMSPSVLRATTMFSFIIIGSALKRQTNIYNTLAASAFVLLILNPFILLQVGFQLSYAAVLGIVYLQPKFYNLYRSSNWLLDKAWAITTVSIAAQIATFPLGMYYFHQFPNYFLLSNLFVIPLATFIINGGILLFAVSTIPVIPYYIAWMVNKMLLFLNFSVEWVDSLPFSLTFGISISTFETMIIYIIILFLIIAIVRKDFQNIRISLLLASFLVSYQIYEKLNMQKQSYFIVYDVPGERVIDFVDGNKNYFIADKDLVNNQSKMRFHIMHYRWERRVQESTLVSPIFKSNSYSRMKNYIQFQDQKILLVDENFEMPENISEIQFDFVVISDKAKVNLENINCRELIIDSSVSYYKQEKIKKECHKWSIPFYNVSTEGAFLLEIKA